MKRILMIIIVLFMACKTISAQYAEECKKQIESITAEEIKEHVSFLADDSMNGRLTGSDEGLLSAIYIAKHFKEYGLTPLLPSSFSSMKKRKPENYEVKLKNAKYFDDYLQYFNVQFSKLSPDNMFSLIAFDETTTQQYTYKFGEDFFLNYKGNDNIKISSQVVLVGYGITEGKDGYNDYLDSNGEEIDVKGKFVMFFDGYPNYKDPDGFYSQKDNLPYRAVKIKAKEAAKRGAVGVIVAQAPLQNKIPVSKQMNSFSSALQSEYKILQSSEKGSLPVFYVEEKISNKIFHKAGIKNIKSIVQKIDDDGVSSPRVLENVKINAELKIDYRTVSGQNVIGFIEGSDPVLKDEYVVIGGHYDHIGHGEYGALDKDNIGQIHNGADDNASGTAGVLELAEAYMQNPPKRSVVFIAFDAEETGLNGAKYYVRHDPLVPIEKTVAMVNLDMIGRNEDDLLYVGGAFYGYDIIKTVEEANKSFNMVLLYNMGLLGSASDQAPFLSRDIPALFFFSGDHPDYHCSTDDIEKINFKKTEKVARLAFLSSWILCNQEKNPVYYDLSMEEKTLLVKKSIEKKKEYLKKNTSSSEKEQSSKK